MGVEVGQVFADIGRVHPGQIGQFHRGHRLHPRLGPVDQAPEIEGQAGNGGPGNGLARFRSCDCHHDRKSRRLCTISHDTADNRALSATAGTDLGCRWFRIRQYRAEGEPPDRPRRGGHPRVAGLRRHGIRALAGPATPPGPGLGDVAGAVRRRCRFALVGGVGRMVSRALPGLLRLRCRAQRARTGPGHRLPADRPTSGRPDRPTHRGGLCRGRRRRGGCADQTRLRFGRPPTGQ